MRLETITCQECKKRIQWSDDTNEQFSSVINKLIYHINNDTQCIRERKLKEIFGTKEKLSQDYWIKK